MARTTGSRRGGVRRRAAGAMVAAGALLLGACSTSPAAGADGGPGGPGPLEVMMAAVHGHMLAAEWDEAEAQRRAAAEDRRSQEFTAACMADLGFDYIPHEPGVFSFGGSGEGTPSGVVPGTREFAERYGFGVSTTPFSPRIYASEAPESPPDPNAERVAAMSPAEREAWDLALWGDLDAELSEELDWRLQRGCWGYGLYRVHVTSTGEDDQFAALAAEVDGHWDRLATDPRIVALDGEWAACMAEAGHPGLPAGEGRLADALWDKWLGEHSWDDAQAEVFSTWDWERFPEGPEGLVANELSEAEFMELEIALAVADFDCRESLDLDARRREVDHELQQQFVDRHGAELEAWALHAAEQRGE